MTDEPTREHQAIELARKLRYDLTAMQTKVTELLRMLGEADLKPPAEYRCECGLTFRGPLSLAEHLYQHHDGPEPAHWVEAEARAEDAA